MDGDRAEDCKLIDLLLTTKQNTFGVQRRYAESITVHELREKLELITGIESQDMKLQLFNRDVLVTDVSGDDRSLKSFIPSHLVDNKNLRLHAESASGHTLLDSDGQLEKFELPDEEYDKRTDSVRAFKKKLQLSSPSDTRKAVVDISASDVGKRCQTRVKDTPTRRGTIMFVGETSFKPGTWVGIKYDEPMGKNDGSVGGTRYFDCPPKYGGFVRPADVEIGDFPEEGLDELEQL